MRQLTVEFWNYVTSVIAIYEWYYLFLMGLIKSGDQQMMCS